MRELKYLLGQRIKEIRVKRGYSQQKLSELINIDQRNLSNIECGNTFPTKSLLKIAEVLGVTLPELFDFNHIPVDINEMKKYIVNNLNMLDENDVRTIYRLIRMMI